MPRRDIGVLLSDVAPRPDLETQLRDELTEKGLKPWQVDIQISASRRYGELYSTELTRLQRKSRAVGYRAPPNLTFEVLAERVADEQIKTEMGDVLKTAQPEPGFFKKALGTVLKPLGAGVEWLERQDPLVAGPFARTPDDGFPAYDPRGRTQFERGAEISRPVARPMLRGIAAPVEAGEIGFEEVTGVPARGKVSGKIKGKVAEDILTEVINPAGLVLVAPIVMQGTQGLRGAALAAQMGSNLLATGLEPRLVQGTLRGLSALGRGGIRTAKLLPAEIKGTRIFQQAMRGLWEGEAGARPLSSKETTELKGLLGRMRSLTEPERIRYKELSAKVSKRPRLTPLEKDVVQTWRQPKPEGFHRLSRGEQDLVGDALTRMGEAPDIPLSIKARTRLPALQQYTDQLVATEGAVGQAREWLKFVRRGAKDGIMSSRRTDEALALLSRSRKELQTARKVIKESTVRVLRDDLLRQVRSAGGDDATAKILERAFNDSVQLHPSNEALLTASSVRQRLARVSGTLKGTTPGVVGGIAGSRALVVEALTQLTADRIHPIFRQLESLLSKELDNIKFTGPQTWAEDAVGAYKSFHIIQHPDWFTGLSPKLRGLMGDAQVAVRSRLETAKALGYPIDALDGAYLEQLWDIPRTGLSVGVTQLPGKVSVARLRLFDDYLTGIRQGGKPADMTVEEIMQHSSALLDQAIGDAWMRQEVLRRFGSKGVRPRLQGFVPFQHPLYRGWSGPSDISNWVSQTYNPVGPGLRKVRNVAAAFKGTAFGIGDIAVAGIQFPLSVAHGGLQLGVGTLNRSLEFLHLPHIQVYDEVAELSRDIQYIQDSMHIGIGPSSIRLGGGTIVKYIPGIGKHVDKPISAVIDFLAQAQFGYGLTAVRRRIHEGNLIALKLVGEDITNPATRRMSGSWANSVTGAARGPQTPTRQAAESIALTSVHMTRANLAVYAQLVKGLGPKASKMERLRTALVFANLGATVYGVQYLFNKVLGDGPMEWIPGRPEWATIRVGGRTVPIIPQRSILRAIDKSIKAIARGEPEDIALAWSQVLIGKASPLVQAPLAAAGFGFEPETARFQLGELSAKGRLVGLAPIPPLAEQAAFQERDVPSLAIAGLGFNPYATPSGRLLKETFDKQYDKELNYESPGDMELVEGNPRLSNLLEKSRKESVTYGSKAAIAREEATQIITEAEVDQGIVRLAEQVLAGNVQATVNWNGARRDFLAFRATVWEAKSVGYEPRTEIGQLVQEYYEFNPKDPEFTDIDGTTNWGAFKKAQEKVLDQMSTLDANAIRRREKFEDRKAEQVDSGFRKAQDKLDPYWAIVEEVWSDLRRREEFAPYDNIAQYMDAKVTELRKLGVPEDELLARLNRLSSLSYVTGIIRDRRDAYRRSHPDTDALLVKWHGSVPIRMQPLPGGAPTRPSGRRGRVGR